MLLQATNAQDGGVGAVCLGYLITGMPRVIAGPTPRYKYPTPRPEAFASASRACTDCNSPCRPLSPAPVCILDFTRSIGPVDRRQIFRLPNENHQRSGSHASSPDGNCYKR